MTFLRITKVVNLLVVATYNYHASSLDRTWFYFAVRGGTFGKSMKINIMNLNRQARLYSQGHVPIMKIMNSKPKWERIRERPTYQV